MRTTIDLDDDILDMARSLTGVSDSTSSRTAGTGNARSPRIRKAADRARRNDARCREFTAPKALKSAIEKAANN